MKIGTAVAYFGESVLLAMVSYKVVGIWGPIAVVALYGLGTVINTMTEGHTVVG